MADEPKLDTIKKPSAGEWRPPFLAALRNSGNVRAACKAAGISRAAAYSHRENSREFRQQWDEAIEDACDILEAEAWQRGRKSSDTLLIFLLKAHRPEKYREVIKQEHGGAMTIKVVYGTDDNATEAAS
jgi:hypothetical protein